MNSEKADTTLSLDCIHSLSAIREKDWNHLTGTENPFLRYEFLAGLESTGCLSNNGWQPCHIILQNKKQQLLGALPLYLKHDSIGEFVFDHDWAQAYHQYGIPYYPKLVSAIPFTPVSGKRLLYHPSLAAENVEKFLLRQTCKLAQSNQFSSVHILFTETELRDSSRLDMLQRYGCQYHWFNHSYTDFDDFLGQLRAKKRKQIKAERRQAQDTGLHFCVLQGDEITDTYWHYYYDFYTSTFARKWGQARFTLDFLQHIGEKLSQHTVLFLAMDGEKPVAGALALHSTDTLYGRHWGCSSYFPALHFELCYYQTLEYCIAMKLNCFNAGAQGEHKINRGFEPVVTYSSHWIANTLFRRHIGNYLQHEEQAIKNYCAELKNNAYRKPP